MAFQEGVRKPGILGTLFRSSTQTPVRERDVPPVTTEVPDTKPAPVPFEPPKIPYKPRKKEKQPLTLGKIIVGGALGALALTESVGAGIHEIKNEQIHSISNIPADLVWPYTMVESWLHKEAPPTFDDNVDNGVIVDNSTVKLSASEIQNLPDSDGNGKPIFLFPLVSKAGGKIEYIKEFQGGLVHPDIEVDSQTTRNLMKLKVPAGTILISPMDGRVFIGVDYRGTKIQNIVSIEFMGEDGLLYHFFIASEGSEDNILQTQINAPKRSEENSNGKEWEKGLPIVKGQKLATITKDANFSMTVFGGLNGTFYGTKLEGNLQFLVDPSGRLVSPQS